jgi:hypothetical protein
MIEIVDTSGFYAYFDNYLQYSNNAVYFPDGTVLVETLHDTYTYPINGWYYFQFREEAELFFGITPDA